MLKTEKLTILGKDRDEIVGMDCAAENTHNQCTITHDELKEIYHPASHTKNIRILCSSVICLRPQEDTISSHSSPLFQGLGLKQ